MRTCPRCGLLSPDRSSHCECGFDLVSDVRVELDRERAGWRASAKRQLGAGIFMVALGAGLSVATYLGASQTGGNYYIFHGLVAVGAVTTWRGFARLRKVAELEANDQPPAAPAAR